MNPIESTYKTFLNGLKPESKEVWVRANPRMMGDVLWLVVGDEETRSYIDSRLTDELRVLWVTNSGVFIREVIVKVEEKHKLAEVVQPVQMHQLKEGPDWETEYRQLLAEMRELEARNRELESQIATLEEELHFERDWKQVNGIASNAVMPSGDTIVIRRSELVELAANITPRAAKTALIAISMVDQNGQNIFDADLISAMCGYTTQKSAKYLVDGNDKIAQIGQGFVTFCPFSATKTEILPDSGKNPSHIYIYDDVYKKESSDIETSSYGETSNPVTPDQIIRERVKFLEQIGFHWKQNWKKIADKVARVTDEQWRDMERAIYAGRDKGLKNPAGMVWDTLNAVPAMAAS